MKNLFKGFDHMKASDDLKQKTRERILEEKTVPVYQSRRKLIWGAVAACMSVVIVGTGVFAVLGKSGMMNQSGNFDLLGGTEGEAWTNGDAALGDDMEPAEDAAPEDTAGEGKESPTTDDEGDTAPTGGDKNGLAAETDGKPGALNPSAGLLTAKAWNDNLHFADWRSLISQNGAFFSYRSGWKLALDSRISVQVRSGQKAVCGAKAVLLDQQGEPIWSAVSDSKGRVYLFYDSVQTPAKITVQYQDIRIEQVVSRTIAEISFDLKKAEEAKSALDLMFVCDTTGSMRDELSYLQTELEDIIRRVKEDNSNIPVRLSVNFYRDHGDSYVTRPFPFTDSIDTALGNLKAQSADGGGDFKEAVEEALADALHQHQWSETASAKLLFLILDAPPHDAAAAAMKKLLTDAAEKGVRIIPVTGSGIDQNTEFLMRSLSVGTGGTYVALTNDSGIGSGHLDPTIGQTETKKLNDLLVEIINDYLSE